MFLLSNNIYYISSSLQFIAIPVGVTKNGFLGFMVFIPVTCSNIFSIPVRLHVPPHKYIVSIDLPLGKKIVYHCFMNNQIRKKLGKFRSYFNGFTYLHTFKPTGKGSPTISNKNDDVSGNFTYIKEKLHIKICSVNTANIKYFNFNFISIDMRQSILKYANIYIVIYSLHFRIERS